VPAEVAIVPRAFVRVDGPDADSYLQGQLSQDLARSDGASFLLEPTGKVVALLRFVREADDSFLLDTDPSAADALLTRLRRFLLRTKATIGPVDGLVCTRFLTEAPAGAIPAIWPDPGVADVVGEQAAADATVDAGEYERRRIEAGVPVSGVDIGPETIPAEAGAWVIQSAVSFTKGCYTGQELVARIDSRGGNVPRPLRVLRLDGDVVAGAAVVTDDGAAAGTVTSAAGVWALGPIARKVEPGARIRVDGVPGTVVR
jgi:folate-binding protein YgfZ